MPRPCLESVVIPFDQNQVEGDQQIKVRVLTQTHRGISEEEVDLPFGDRRSIPKGRL